MLKFTKAAEKAPCKEACPAGIDIPRYIRSIREGKFDNALAVIREKIPFPSVCGRVCFRPCEVVCQARYLGGPVGVNALKRFVAEQVPVEPTEAASFVKPFGKRVAIVGSGPAGLTAAYYLAKLGHGVTIFEKLPEAGGTMRFGIPAYRLPIDVLNREIDAIAKIGVEIKTGTKVESLNDLLNRGYGAVFVAVGAHKSVRMGIEGEDDPAVMDVISFLRRVNSGERAIVGNRVVVAGGGNAAIDAARTALRLGAKEVTIVYRRSRDEMLADSAEVDEALTEGVEILFLAAPNKIIRKNGKVAIECIRTKLCEVDGSGRRRPEPILGSEFSLDADTVIAAIGEQPEIPDQFRLSTTQVGTLQVDSETLATSREGIFAGGDAVTGLSSVIEAIAMGRKAASSIDKCLGGEGIIEEKLASSEEDIKPLTPGLPLDFPVERPKLPLEERLKGFAEVDLTCSEASALEEATRCLMCDLPIVADGTKCTVCMVCQMICSFRFSGNSFNLSEAAIKLKRTEQGTCEIEFTDKCDHCGLCARYCSYGSLTQSSVRS